jgi:UDP-N-acetylglucosamine 2-epimerase (non-hydrolysing)
MLDFKAITIRDSMERPEALEAGSIVMSGTNPKNVLQSIEIVLQSGGISNIPSEYQINDTSIRVLNYIISTVNQHKFWNALYND